MNKHLVFVYGSLRRGSARAMSNRFPDSRFIAGATVNGHLYDLGEFPGLLLNESGAAVTGEVYEIDEDVLKSLDDFEATSNYRRKQVEITLGFDRKVCWVYEPDPEHYSLRTLIASGDWIEYARTKAGCPEDAIHDDPRS
jgi:gamma-glutamylcyclotransferase (GGCT)/AIG2-like uncharacterized protein YtfP